MDPGVEHIPEFTLATDSSIGQERLESVGGHLSCDRYKTRSEILANLPGQGNWLMKAERTIRNVPWGLWVGGGLLLGTIATLVIRRRSQSAATSAGPS